MKKREFKKLKVGDKVRAIDDYYNITSKKNSWEGVVIHISKDSCQFVAETTQSKKYKRYINEPFSMLYYEHFEKVELPKIDLKAEVDELKNKVKVLENKVADLEKEKPIAISIDSIPCKIDIEPEEPTYKEVKRKAKAGEYIKIVTPHYAFGLYSAGDILKVTMVKTNGVFFTTEKAKDFFVLHNEYVVLEGYKPPRKKRTSTKK